MITLPVKARITSLYMTDMQGRITSPGITLHGNSAELDVQALAEGIYLVRVAYDGGMFQQKVLKVK